MRDIRASAEVRAFLGAENLRRLHDNAVVRYECWECGRTGRATEPTSIIVLGYRVFRAAKFAHAACADSRIIEVNAAGWAEAGDCCLAGPAVMAVGGTAASLRRDPPGKGVRGMKTTRLARTLGLDGNPLRRRTDKIAACLAALLLVAFMIGAPLLSAAVVGWAARSGISAQQAARSWRQVPAVLLRAASSPVAVRSGLIVYTWVPARWTAPDGRMRTGRIPVTVDLAAGRTVPLWVDAAGSPVSPPPDHGAVVAGEVAAATAATCALGIVLLCLALAGRWVLDRRRLASWAAAWITVGPQWTKRFRSRG